MTTGLPVSAPGRARCLPCGRRVHAGDGEPRSCRCTTGGSRDAVGSQTSARIAARPRPSPPHWPQQLTAARDGHRPHAARGRGGRPTADRAGQVDREATAGPPSTLPPTPRPSAFSTPRPRPPGPADGLVASPRSAGPAAGPPRSPRRPSAAAAPPDPTRHAFTAPAASPVSEQPVAAGPGSGQDDSLPHGDPGTALAGRVPPGGRRGNRPQRSHRERASHPPRRGGLGPIIHHGHQKAPAVRRPHAERPARRSRASSHRRQQTPATTAPRGPATVSRSGSGAAFGSADRRRARGQTTAPAGPAREPVDPTTGSSRPSQPSPSAAPVPAPARVSRAYAPGLGAHTTGPSRRRQATGAGTRGRGNCQHQSASPRCSRVRRMSATAALEAR